MAVFLTEDNLIAAVIKAEVVLLVITELDLAGQKTAEKLLTGFGHKVVSGLLCFLFVVQLFSDAAENLCKLACINRLSKI